MVGMRITRLEVETGKTMEPMDIMVQMATPMASIITRRTMTMALRPTVQTTFTMAAQTTTPSLDPNASNSTSLLNALSFFRIFPMVQLMRRLPRSFGEACCLIYTYEPTTVMLVFPSWRSRQHKNSSVMSSVMIYISGARGYVCLLPYHNVTS